MMSKSNPPLILVDGSSYLFRAYYALPALMNSKKMPTGAIYGVVNMLKKLSADYPDSDIAVVFDTKGKTFRHELYKDYKANRAVMPDELAVQIKPLHELIKALGFPLIMVAGVEADDVIGTLAHHAEKAGVPILISTGDKDMAQLVNDTITCVNTMTNHTLDAAGVEAKFGVKPKQIIDYLALIGDTSDNVPGVPKVGPKTAAKWLQTYGSIEAIKQNADKIGGKVGENLRAHIDQLTLAQTLVTIQLDVPLPLDFADIKQTSPQTDKLKKYFQELEFKTWLTQVLEGNESVADSADTYYETVLTETELAPWLQRLEKADCFAFDTETTDLDQVSAEIVGISLSVAPNQACYIPVGHVYEGAPEQLKLAAVLSKLAPIFRAKNKCIIGQNLKYDLGVLQKYHVDIKAELFDTMLASYVLNSTASRHNMDTLALKHLGKTTIHYEDVVGKGKKQINFSAVELEKAAPYAAEDADITFQLYQQFAPKLAEDKKLTAVFDTIEMPLMPVLSRVENNGVLIDEKFLNHLSTIFANRIEKLQQKAYAEAGQVFNLASPKQLQEILFGKLNLPTIKKTPKGQPSTAEEVLSELALDYPLPKLILEFRSLSKLKSTYTDALPLQINPLTGRVHTSYNQAVTATGRLSSTNPNLQNIPVKTEEGRKIREAFIAPEGCKILSADYSQIELRIMAHLSKDKGLLDAFAKGLDIHKATAAEVFGVHVDAVTFDQRRHAKAINFGLIYGMSAFGLAKQMGVSRDVAQEYVDLYFHRYPGVKVYMEKTCEQAHEHGFVETHFGRRLYLPDIHASNVMRRKASERAAINGPMQGTSADIIKLAMIDIDHWITEQKQDIKMIMQVHDELVFEVPEKSLKTVQAEVVKRMMATVKLSVPLTVATGVGSNWAQAH